MFDFRTMSVFFALLASAAALFALSLVGSRLGGRDGVWSRVRAAVGPQAMALAWLVAIVATLGSLYYSEVIGLEPCVLCWYQRIAMYPLVLLLGIAVLRRDAAARRYVLPLALVGGTVSLVHTVLEWLPVQDTALCSADVPCGVAPFHVLGFWSLASMALAGFALIAALMLTVETDS